MLNAELLVNLWLAGFLVAIVLQVLLQRYLASHTSWGFAPGWQREIAFWNIAFVALIFYLRQAYPHIDKDILPALALLSVLLGTNHLVSGLRNPKMSGHWAGAVGNFLGVLLYALFGLSK